MKNLFFFILIVLGPLELFSQLTTSTAQGPAALVQNILLGPGVTVSNIQYNGANTAIGSFTAPNTNLGIASGIVMTTGTVLNNGNGPHGPNNQASSGFDNKTPGLSLLSNLVGGTTTYNASILEFDFVPYSDTVRFKYVFGSEEYPEFVGSTFNDVFAFFISGPGIAGQQNIAKLANGQAVTINNVNSGSNNLFYVDNGDGSTPPYDSSPQYIQYDGFTKVLEAVSKVECGETYHLIITLADAGDSMYDSGIFLEANSLSSEGDFNVTSSISYQAYGDSKTLAEGCVSGSVTFERSGNNLPALTIPITISGTATNGVDYTTIPSSISFNQNQTSVTLNFDAINDGNQEPDETILLSFVTKDACNNDVIINVDFIIKDPEPIQVTVESGGVLCPGDDLEVIASITGGVGPFSYLWNTNETTSSIFVTPSTTSVYTVNVYDNCLQTNTTASGTVNVPVYQPISLNTSGDITETCPYVPHTLEVFPNGGAGNYTFQWESNTQSDIIGNSSSLDVLPSTTTNFKIKVTDQCGIADSTNILYTVTSPPMQITISNDTLICPGDSALVSVSASGGVPDYVFLWNETRDTTMNVWVKPDSTSVYTVSASDSCQTFSLHGQVTISVTKPIPDFKIVSTVVFDGLPITFQNLTQGGETYQWDLGNGETSQLTNPTTIYNTHGYFDVNLIAIDSIGCKDTLVKTIFIEEAYYLYVPNTFTPNENRVNNLFQASTEGIKDLSIEIFNRWGEEIFSSNEPDFEWDGTFNGNNCKTGTYIYKIKYLTNSGRDFEVNGHINLIR